MAGPERTACVAQASTTGAPALRTASAAAVIVDDMVDTAGTLSAAASAVRAAGAPVVLACATHPVLSGPAMSRLAASSLDELVVTDTIPLGSNSAKIRVLTVAPLLGEAIKRTHEEASISSLFV